MNLLDVLGKGRSNARPSSYLSDVLNISQRDVRRLVNIYRSKGYPICSETLERPRGYYLAENKEELLDSIKQLENRIMSMQMAIDGLKGALYVQE